MTISKNDVIKIVFILKNSFIVILKWLHIPLADEIRSGV